MRYPSADSKVSSAVGKICVPILFFKRWTRTLLLVGGGVGSDGLRIRGKRKGTRNSDSPLEPSCCEPVRPRATEISLSVALENHFTPSKVYWGPNFVLLVVANCAVVSVREMSDPPGRYTTFRLGDSSDRECGSPLSSIVQR